MADVLDKVEGEQDSWMRRFLPLLIGVSVTLLAGCETRKEICARADSENMDALEAMKKLGIENGLHIYCQYYK